MGTVRKHRHFIRPIVESVAVLSALIFFATVILGTPGPNSSRAMLLTYLAAQGVCFICLAAFVFFIPEYNRLDLEWLVNKKAPRQAFTLNRIHGWMWYPFALLTLVVVFFINMEMYSDETARFAESLVRVNLDTLIIVLIYVYIPVFISFLTLVITRNVMVEKAVRKAAQLSKAQPEDDAISEEKPR